MEVKEVKENDKDDGKVEEGIDNEGWLLPALKFVDEFMRIKMKSLKETLRIVMSYKKTCAVAGGLGGGFLALGCVSKFVGEAGLSAGLVHIAEYYGLTAVGAKGVGLACFGGGAVLGVCFVLGVCWLFSDSGRPEGEIKQ